MLNEELELIKQAIVNEVEGYEFYRMAANQSASIGSKEALLLLAEEELKHVEYLKLLFDKMKNGAAEDYKLAFLSDPPSPNIYNWNKVEKESIGLAMSVFSVGMQMERDAIAFYENARENTSMVEAKKLFSLLIGWEKIHYEQFSLQYQIYKVEWWLEQGFSPY
ncbi:MAG: rubrerythrin [Firmicutes bacterium HGW-Firmicutes-1]|jgi:rubrerythrin|nr:MAG: rubrerythrin [Firmicutes bacterium HGW-Firmicutes-1]